jgi:oligo-alginate lyase
MNKLLPFLCALLFLSPLLQAVDQASQASHPRLLWTHKDIAELRDSLGKLPAFDAIFQQRKARIDRVLAEKAEVPVPADVAAYTHERHKVNYIEMQIAGFMYQATQDSRYAAFVKARLDLYADLIPTLKFHPKGKGRLFWQPLNDAVWMVNVAQAYDFIWETLSPVERERYEKQVLRPMAEFMLVDCQYMFDMIHNHGTWAVTSAGMIACAIGDQDLIDRCLKGSKKDGKSGYLTLLNQLYSPDGTYFEGPYYSRYALMPFYLFATALENNRPEAKLFEMRGGMLGKALWSTLQQTYGKKGFYIPINDNLKEMSFSALEAEFGVGEAFRRYANKEDWLAVAQQQDAVSLSAGGLAVARALKSDPRPRAWLTPSTQYRDGAEGDKGGLGILRTGSRPEDLFLAMKYTGLGMGHGHYDKLSFSLYDQGIEVIQDYGAARFLEIEQKNGGRYLPENETWAKQTVAHNTVVVDAVCQYGGVYEVAEPLHSERHFFDASKPEFQVVSAKDRTAVPGVEMLRTMAIVRDARLDHPVVVDLFRLSSATEHQYDYVLYYKGHYMEAGLPLKTYDSERRQLGKAHGYEHLWLEAEGKSSEALRFTWLSGIRFYSMISAASPDTQVLFTRIGAGDPKFNLRNDPGLILRRKAANHCFATVIEPHGVWEGTKEDVYGVLPNLSNIEILANTAEGTALRVSGKKGLEWILLFNAGAASDTAEHSLDTAAGRLTWKGNASIIRK